MSNSFRELRYTADGAVSHSVNLMVRKYIKENISNGNLMKGYDKQLIDEVYKMADDRKTAEVVAMNMLNKYNTCNNLLAYDHHMIKCFVVNLGEQKTQCVKLLCEGNCDNHIKFLYPDNFYYLEPWQEFMFKARYHDDNDSNDYQKNTLFILMTAYHKG